MDKSKKKGRKPKKRNTYQCEACAGYQDEPIVACDKCDKWYHFTCVGIKTIGRKDVWICDKCKQTDPPVLSQQSIAECGARKVPSPTKTQQENRGDNRNDYDLRYDQRHQYYRANLQELLSSRDHNESRSIRQQQSQPSQKVRSVTSSNRQQISRKIMELEMIEEERLMSQRRDNEYLRRKYSVLMKEQRRGERASTYDCEVQSLAHTREWVENQRSIKSRNADRKVNEANTNTFDQEDFARRLEELKLGKPMTEASTRHTNYRDNDNLLQCGECSMVGEEEYFDACLLCFKQYHYECMDIIMLDEETRYVCPACKNFNQQERAISLITTPTIRQPVTKPPVNENPPFQSKDDTALRPCNTCKSTSGQHELKSCDVCDKLCHLSCMSRTAIDKDVKWICANCKKIQKPKSEPQQDNNLVQSTPLDPNDNMSRRAAVTSTKAADTQLMTGASQSGANQTLTSAQIASRHVVTRDLPIFVGKPEQWPMFRSRFDNSTRLCGFSDSENLDRLQKCLKGNALEAVRSRLPTAESVPDIMETLEMLYGRPELIVNSLMKKIRSEPPPKADKLNTSVDFALSVKNVCATLEQANLNSHLSNPALIQELVDKLPTNIKIEWARCKSTVVNVSLSTLAQFLYDLAKVISTVTEPTVNKDSKDEYKAKTSFHKKDASQKESSQNDSAHVYTLEEMKINHAHSHLVVPSIIDAKNFSNWNKMHRAMAYVERFISILRAKVKRQTVPHGPLTQEELINAQEHLLRQAQFEDFAEEMILLMRNKNLPLDKQTYVKTSSPLYKCTPYLDEDGLIKIQGRIDLASGVSSSTKRPIILPRNNSITRLLVAYYHKMYHHRNHRTVFNEIRQKYYIPSLRVVLNSVRNECQRCKNKRARAEPPQMANLPAARLAIGFRAFTFVGIDYFGPMYVVIGRRVEKRWGVLFVCMTTRAVHTELAYHLDTQSCIMCVRNFINLRGCPREFFSDQGTNLKGMDNTLKDLVSQIDHHLLASEFTTCYTKWHFNSPASPHMGGAWESMVKSVKNCLHEIMPTRHPTEDMLRSLLLEVCNIVNSRPLTYVPLDQEEDEIITPNHFILGASNGLKPFVDVDPDSPILRSKWMENQRLTDIFWQKFVKEFLPDLTRRTKWHQPTQPIQVGDIVLLVDGKNVRGQYPKAHVIEIAVGSNDQVRRARIQLFTHTDTKMKQSIFWRPVVSLAKLDVHRRTVGLSDSQRGRQTEGSVVNADSGQVNADSGQERRDQIGIDNITQRNVIDLSSIVPIENGDD